MPYDITLPNGEVVEVDDSLEPEKAAGLIKQQKPELFKTNLLSIEGLKSLATTPGDLVEAGAANTMAGLHRMKEGLLQYGQDRYPDERRQPVLEKARQTGHEYAAAGRALEQTAEAESPNPSWPLQAAQSIIPSMAQAPASILTGGLVPTAQAYNQAKSQGTTDANAAAYAGIAGPAEVITEFIPLGKFFKEIGTEPLKKTIAKMLGREIATENVNVIVEHLAEQAFVTPDRPLKEALDEYIHKAAVATMAAGGQTAVMGTAAKAGEAVDEALMANSPESTNNTSRELPPIQEVDPSVPPPAPKQKVEASPLTDAEVEFEANRELIAQIDASLDSMGLGEPVSDVATEAPDPVAMAVNPQVVGLSERQIADTGLTREVLSDPNNFSDKNTSVPRDQRRVLRAMGGSPVIGGKFSEQPLTALDTSQGPIVMQVGEDTAVRPGHYMKGVMEDIYRLAREFNPGGIYVILPEDTRPVGNKNHAAGGYSYHNGIHYIIPRHMTNLTKEGSHKTKEGENEYSTYAKAQAWSTLDHEFGHSVITSFMINGLSKEEATLFEQGAASGKIDEAVLAKLNPKAAAAVRAWEELRQKIMMKQISGKQAALMWLSPTKLMSKQGMKESYGDGMGVFTPEALARTGFLDYQLNFHEFAAEQMAKMLYARGEMKVSKTLAAVFKNYDPEGLMTWVDERVAAFLEPLLDLMKGLYFKIAGKEVTGDELQQIGVDAIPEMKEWFALLAENARQRGLARTTKEVKRQAPKEVPVEDKIDWNNPTRQNILKSTLRELWKSGQVKRNSQQHRQLSAMLTRGDFDNFINAVEPMLTEKLRFDITEHEAADVKGWTPAWVVGHGTFHIWKSNDVDLNKVNTGEKTIWQGWGFYVGEAKKTFRHYASYSPDGYDYTWRRDGKNYDPHEVFDMVTSALHVDMQSTDIDSLSIQLAIIDELIADPTNARMQVLRNSFGDEHTMYIVKVAREVKKFKKTRGDQQVRHFEVLRPLEDFLMFDYDLWQQSPQVQAALSMLPKEYQWDQDVILEGLMDSSWPPNITIGSDKNGDTVIYDHELGAPVKYQVGDIIPYGHGQGEKVVEIIDDPHSALSSSAVTETGKYVKAYHAKVIGKVTLPKDEDYMKYLHKQYAPYYIGKIEFGGDLQRPGETYYWWLVTQLAKRDKAPYHPDIIRNDVKHAKEASTMLYRVGVAGNAYLNNGARGQRIVPPGMNEGDWNLVVFDGKDVRFIKTDNEWVERVVKDENGMPHKERIIRGLPPSADKLGQAKARKEWLQLGAKSPAFQAWMEGSVAKTAKGEPLPLFFNTSVTTTLDKREFFVGYKHPNASIWMNGAASQMRGNTRIVPGYMAIKNQMELEVDSPHVPIARLLEDVRRARSAGYDGLIYRAPDRRDDVYVAVDKEFAAVDPDFKHVGNAASEGIRFDLVSPEGSEAASKWSQLKNLGVSKLADGLYKLYNAQWYGLQLQQLAHMNPQWTWLTEFAANALKYYRKVGEMHSRADNVLRQIEWLGKENLTKLSKFTRAEAKGGEHWTDMRVDQHDRWTHIPNATTYEKLKEFGIDPDSAGGKHFLSLYIEAKNANQYQMDEMERVLFALINRKYADPTMHLQRAQKIRELRMTFRVRRASPFWANDAFGQFHIAAFKNKEKVYEAATDSLREAEELKTAAIAKYGEAAVKSFEVSYEESILMRLPIEFIDEASQVLGLDMNNPDDRAKRDALSELMGSLYSKSPDQTYDPNKMLIEGGSTDFQKNFANFAMKNANFIAKMEYRKYLQNSIAQAKNEAADQRLVKDQEKINRAVEFMWGTANYMLNPQEEIAFIRGTIAISYLMYNVKTAVLNVVGLMATWATLNRELGYLKGTYTFGKTTADAVRTLGHEGGTVLGQILTRAAQRANNSVTDPNWEMVNGQPTELRRALEQAKSENVLDQSYAYYLAGQAMKGELSRMASASAPGKAFKGFIDTGMSLFRATELLTRRASFLAAYEVQQQVYPEKTEKQRYEEATRMVGLMQGDYTKGNRPELFRGQIKSFLFIFMTYVQNQAWATYGGMDKGLKRQDAMQGRISPKFYRSYSMQMMLMLMFLAGPEGIPGGENIMDLIDIVYKWIFKKSARTAVREMLVEMEADPMLWTRGIAFNTAGFDIGKSIGLGRLVPMTDRLGQEYQNSTEALGTMAYSAMGVGGGYVKWLVESAMLMSDTAQAGTPLTDAAGKVAAKLPGGPGNIFKAAQWAEIDARGPSGGLLAWDEEKDRARSVHPWEIVGKGLGFQPSSVSRGQAMRMDTNEVMAYWKHRKDFLYAAWGQANLIAKDREAIADVRAALKRYNEQVPHQDLRITEKMLKQSLARREENLKRSDTMTPVAKSMRAIVEQAKETF